MKHKKIAVFIIAVTALLIVTSIITNGNISTINEEELGKSLGFLTLVPTIVSVVLAFLTHNVLFSLLIRFLSGVLILGIVYATSIGNIPSQIFSYLFISIEDVVKDIDNIEILLLCFAVGGMIEVVRSSGGFESLAIKLQNRINSPRKANLLASFLGLIIGFDDYANTLIVGPIMKPITDRVKVSREKLAFIVDSTAAPVAGIAVVSSWVAVEVASINKGLEIIGLNTNGFSIFVNSIPFCFYCLFAITFVFVNSFIGKDFGPMLKAEKQALENQESDDVQINAIDNNLGKRMFVAVGSIVLLVLIAIITFYFDGRENAIASNILTSTSPLTFENIIKAISEAKTIRIIIIASIISSLFAIILGCKYKLFTFKESTKSWLTGVKRITGTVVMLAFAWCLATVTKKIGAIYFAIEIISANVSPIVVPILIFGCCCLISCASGSFGCMFVVMPLAIPLAYTICTNGIAISDEIYLLICVGSVVAGSIFGDHCSPITDCTILAASGSGCETMNHCYTQLPYTIVNALISAIWAYY